MVAEGDVARALQAGRLERQLGAVHEARVARPGGERARRPVGVIEAAGLEHVAVVLHAGVAGGLAGRAGERAADAALDARVGIDPPALEQPDDPLRLVDLLVVGRVAGGDRQRQPRAAALAVADRALVEAVDLLDDLVDDERLERLLRAPRRGEGGVRDVEHLGARRRLLVGELEVRQLGEVQQRAAAGEAALARRGAEVVAHDALPARAELQPRVRRAGVADDRRVGGRRLLQRGGRAPGPATATASTAAIASRGGERAHGANVAGAMVVGRGESCTPGDTHSPRSAPAGTLAGHGRAAPTAADRPQHGAAVELAGDELRDAAARRGGRVADARARACDIEGLLGLGPAIVLAAGALAALPAGLLMDRMGRVPVLAGGFSCGIAGCLLAALGSAQGWAVAVLLGLVLVGTANATGLLARDRRRRHVPARAPRARDRARALRLGLRRDPRAGRLQPAAGRPRSRRRRARRAVARGAAGFMVAGLAIVLTVRPDPKRIAELLAQAGVREGGATPRPASLPAARRCAS